MPKEIVTGVDGLGTVFWAYKDYAIASSTGGTYLKCCYDPKTTSGNWFGRIRGFAAAIEWLVGC